MVGTFGDASTDLDRVIKGIAESRVLFLSRKEGQLVTDAWAGQVLGQQRRFFCGPLCPVPRGLSGIRLHPGPGEGSDPPWTLGSSY